MARQYIVLTSGSSWSVPADWNNSDNTVHVIAGGTSGATGGNGGKGGGYARRANVELTPGGTASYAVAGVGGTSWFKDTGTVRAVGQSGTNGDVLRTGGNNSGKTGGGAANINGNGSAPAGGSGTFNGVDRAGNGGSAGTNAVNGIKNQKGQCTTNSVNGTAGGAGGNYGGGGGGGGAGTNANSPPCTSRSARAGGTGRGGIIMIEYEPFVAVPKTQAHFIHT